jgi:hypothetical protein
MLTTTYNFPNGFGAATHATLGFKRSSKSAVQGLAPGTCAWQDRGVASAEPSKLCFTRVVGIFLTGGSYSSNVYGMAARLGAADGSTITIAGAKRLFQFSGAFDLQDDNKYAHFRAYNDGRNCLVVTKIGL